MRSGLRQLVVAVALVALAAPAVAAADCPGATGACPYRASSVVGRRAEGALRFPQGIAVGPGGQVYVADQFGRDVQRFAADGTPLGAFGSQGTGDGEFSAGIGGLAADPATGNVYAIDSRANRIEQFTADGTFVRAFGGPGTGAGQFSFGGGTDSDDTAGGGLVVGGGKLWVVDTLQNRVQRLALDGTGAAVLSFPAGTGPLNIPEGVGWDAAAGVLYVADNRNQRVLAVKPQAGADTLDAVAATTGRGTAPDGSPALDQPYDVALDGGGRAWVASDQNSRLVELGPPADGSLPFLGVFGGFGPGPGQVEFPRSIAVSAAGEVFLAEAGTNRVQVFGADGASLRTFGFPARAGGDLTLPQGLVGDPYGDVLVADTFAYRGLDLQPDGSVRDVVGAAKLFDTKRDPEAQTDRFLGLADLATAPDGTLLGLDSRARRVVRFDADGRVLGVLARDVASSRAGAAEGGIAVAPDGGVWVSDAGGNVVKRLDPVTGAVTAALGGTGAAPGQLAAPQGVRIAADGDLWVADGGNHRVQELRPDGSVVRVLGASGPVAEQLDKPVALALDGRGRVYVADVARSKVLVFDTGTGAYVTQWGQRGVLPGQLLHPRGVAVDCAGTVTVADTDANRLQRFVPVEPGPSTCVPRPVPAPPAPAPQAPVATAPDAGPPAPVARPRPAAAAPSPARVSVRLARSAGALGRRGVAVRLRCDVACVLRPSFVLSAGRTGRRVAAGPARALAARRTRTLAVRPRAAVAAVLRRHLGRRHLLRLAVVVRAARAGAPTSRVARAFTVRP